MTVDERGPIPAVPPSPVDVDELADLLEDVSRRLAAIELPVSAALVGDGATAAENRSIRGAQAHLVRADTRALRAEVAEVRRRARDMARGARRAQAHAHRLGPVLLEPDAVPAEVLERLCGDALHLAASVCWAQIAVTVRGEAVIARSAGELAEASVEAVAQGPRAAASRSGAAVVVDDVGADPRWPALRAGDHPPAAVLAVPLGAGTGGTLTLAARTAGTFDAAVRAVAAEVARHVGRVLAAGAVGSVGSVGTAGSVGRAGETSDPAARARDTVAAARVLLARRDRVGTEVAFEALLERAARSGDTVLGCAEKVVDELGPGAVDGDAPVPEPATLRRAVSYLEEHAAEEVDVADVAAAAGVGVRGLQMVFRRWRDTTPLRHLRDIRLARAHEDLLAADAREGLTVADVIARWHFTHPGRFAVTYRRRYGCSPSETLRA